MRKEKVICSVCGSKNRFPKLMECEESDALYPGFCPDPEQLEELEINGILQQCEECGYTFPRIDEHTRIERKFVDRKAYRHPFGEAYTGPESAVKCFRTALVYNNVCSEKFAAQWYLYAGLLAGEPYQKRCFKRTLRLLKWKMEQNQRMRRKPDVEMMLAYLNVMRLLGMFRCVKEIGCQMQSQFTGVDRQLLEAIMALAEKGDSSYRLYFDMLTEV